ncbi:MAG: glycine cleavage system protein GcvH [Candidatus Hydrogenedentota bacterium]
MLIPEDLKYTEEHEWIKIEGDIGIVGITDYAQDQLGDIVYFELPVIGKKIKKGETVCVVESVKSASDIYSPVTGEVIEINEKVKVTPETVNKNPYNDGWLFKIKLSNIDEINDLLTPSKYRELIE